MQARVRTRRRRLGITAVVLLTIASAPLIQAGPATATVSAPADVESVGDPPLPSYPGTPITEPTEVFAAVATTPVPCGNNGSDKALTGAAILDRARSWLSVGGVPYSQSRCYRNQHGDYRTDCSGFVSMAWGLGGSGSSFWTGNLLSRSRVIPRSNLQPGDALLRHAGNPSLDHVALFVRWYDSSRTQPLVYEQTGSGGTIQSVWSSSYAALYTPVRYNNLREGAQDVPLTGDWNGDGRDTVGVYRPGTKQFHLRNSNTSGVADYTFTYGVAGDVPIVGDWNRDGRDTVGVYRPSTKQFLLRDSNSSGDANVRFTYGRTGDIPLVGDWNRDGRDTIGIRRGKVFMLRNSNSSGDASVSFTYGR